MNWKNFIFEEKKVKKIKDGKLIDLDTFYTYQDPRICGEINFRKEILESLIEINKLGFTISLSVISFLEKIVDEINEIYENIISGFIGIESLSNFISFRVNENGKVYIISFDESVSTDIDIDQGIFIKNEDFLIEKFEDIFVEGNGKFFLKDLKYKRYKIKDFKHKEDQELFKKFKEYFENLEYEMFLDENPDCYVFDLNRCNEYWTEQHLKESPYDFHDEILKDYKGKKVFINSYNTESPEGSYEIFFKEKKK